MVAVDPAHIAIGSWVYITPNPFGWDGPFLAADTGGAIRGKRIDFYEWRGRQSQLAWGMQTVTASAEPTITPQPVSATSPIDAAVACDGAPDVGGSGEGRRAATIAARYLNRDARISSFSGFEPPRTSLAWCAWFLTNVWKKAGVNIPISWWSGYPYQWAQASHPELIIKHPGRQASTTRVPVGTALMFGRSPAAGQSDHVNMVRAVNPDGTLQIIGGNQDGSRVTSYGPCRLTNGTSARLAGPGCDTRPIYSIVAPSTSSNADSPRT